MTSHPATVTTFAISSLNPYTISPRFKLRCSPQPSFPMYQSSTLTQKSSGSSFLALNGNNPLELLTDGAEKDVFDAFVPLAGRITELAMPCGNFILTNPKFVTQLLGTCNVSNASSEDSVTVGGMKLRLDEVDEGSEGGME